MGQPLQENHSDCSRVAQHALFWDLVAMPDPSVPAQSTSSFQPNSSQESVKAKPAFVAPRASAIKKQGFSDALAATISVKEAQPDQSMIRLLIATDKSLQTN